MPYEGVVFHYTASRHLEGTLSWLCNPEAKASAHFVVDRDGTLYQLASLDVRTWHAGGATSRFRMMSHVNQRTIGIEMMNLGPLGETRQVGKDPVSEADKHEWNGPYGYASDHYWEAYPEELLLAVVKLTRELQRRYNGLKEPSSLLGHEHVDPTRKRDPGPLFPWERVRLR